LLFSFPRPPVARPYALGYKRAGAETQGNAEQFFEMSSIAQEVAGRLQGEILAGRYQAGDKLPPERKLAVSLGINRGTLREALKRLEHMGLVRSRQGDGTRVLDFLQTAGLDLLRVLFPVAKSSGIELLGDVLEARQIIGREVARLAAARARPEQIERLAAIATRATSSPEQTLQQDLDFFVELARATHNLVFILLLNSVRSAVRNLSGLFADFNPPAEQVRKHHQQLIAGLRARDSASAANAADRHLQSGKEHLLAKIGGSPEVPNRASTAEADVSGQPVVGPPTQEGS
jgi:GntR family transcriptional repressor for pyruvate dehydrogenase complex